MQNKERIISKEELFTSINEYIKNEADLDLISKAYDFASFKHAKQFRNSGEPYINHLIAVAYELAKLRVETKTICAGLLHDVIEDQNVSKEEFIELFDEEIYNLVEAVTKIGKLNQDFKDEKEYQAANHRKIFIAMAKDIRVILVKLVDRLHNMRTLRHMSPDKQLRIAKETLEVYASIAHRLGIASIKNELEDLAFSYLNPEEYKNIARLVEIKKSEREKQIKDMIDEISLILDKHQISFKIFGRSKHFYSIHKKMLTKNKHFEEILDLLAIRIITKSKLNCYEILGYIHDRYKPIPGRLKDYIAMPKMNLYQSLHTTIVAEEGRIFEVQIRTEEMNRIAEKGVAAHWSYKEDKKFDQNQIKKELKWLKAFEDSSSDNPTDYMDTVANDIFNANVYVLTPKGRVIDLPSGSIPLDFAYRIHTEVGHQTVGAKINGLLVPLNTILKTGDVVEMIVDKKSKPSEDWLKICKTNNAKNRIKAYLSRKDLEHKQENYKTGEQMLKEELRKRNLDLNEYLKKEKIEECAASFQCSGYVDFMYAIYNRKISLIDVIDRLLKTKKNTEENKLKGIDIMIEKARNRRKKAISKTGISVDGLPGLKIGMASCCNPIYGDDIIGYVSKGMGIKVHLKNCPKLKELDKRLISVTWDHFKDPNIKYEVAIRIFSRDRNFLLSDLINIISQQKASLINVNSSVNKKELSVTTKMQIVIDDTDHLNSIISNLKKVSNVIDVERVYRK